MRAFWARSGGVATANRSPWRLTPAARAAAPVALPIEDVVKVYLCQWAPAESTFHCAAGGTLSVDAQQETLTLTGDVPGIQAGSRVFFYAKDYNPGGPLLEETSTCTVTTSAAGR